MTNAEITRLLSGQLDQLRTPAGYYNAGLPNYDHLFGRDACISALQLLHRDTGPARATLETLSHFQSRRERLLSEAYPGKILHEHYVDGVREQLHALLTQGDKLRQLSTFILWRFPYYGSVDSGAWYLILLHHYAAASGDTDLVRSLWPTVEDILTWLDRHATHTYTGLVGFRRHYIFGLRNQSWKDNLNLKIDPPTAMIEVQGYYYYALGLMAELAETVMHDAERAEQLRQRASLLQQMFRTYFRPVNGSYPLAVDGRGKRITNVTSNPGHLLFTGILDRGEAELIINRLFQDDLLTSYGIRTEATTEPTFNPVSYQNGSVWPFDNWVIAQGLTKAGYPDKATQITSGLIKIVETWQRLPELYAVEDNLPQEIAAACRIQAWSAGALINLLDEAPPL